MGYVVWYIYIVYIYGNKVRVCVQPVNGTPRVPLTRDQTMYRPQSYIVG